MKRTFPIYQQTRGALYCFLGPTHMFKVEPIGTNKNPGLAIDEYVTRKMVLAHLCGPSNDITRERFQELYEQLFRAALQKIMSPC